MKKIKLNPSPRNSVQHLLNSRIYLLVFGLIALINIFFRFFQLSERYLFEWDQLQNAWVMKTMFVDGKLPLVGMVTKASSGFHIGPAYYYILAPFYGLFRLDPIGGTVMVGLISFITLIVFFVITKKMFGTTTALVAAFLYTVTDRVIQFDRIVWPVNFIPLLSILTFYFLYQATQGKPKYLLSLALTLGAAFHFHFTAIFLVICVILASPLFLRYKEGIKYSVLAIPLFLLWFVPNIVADITKQSASSVNFIQYAETYYHGVHVRRMIQLFGDAFIEYEGVFLPPAIRFLKYSMPIVFSIFLIHKKGKYTGGILTYLTLVWFFVPWLVLSTYKGELTDYYYTTTRPLVILSSAAVLAFFIERKKLFFVSLSCIILAFYTYANVQQFLSTKYGTYLKYKKAALDGIEQHKPIPFSDGYPAAYIYGAYMYQQTGIWP